MEGIEDKFYKWAATHGDDKEDANMCKYGMDMMIDFVNHVMKVNDSEVDITKPLEVGCITFHPIDKDGYFEIDIDSFGDGYIHTEEVKEVIDFLTKSINEW